MEKELCDKIYFKVKKGKNLQDLINELELKEHEIIGLIKLMNENGYGIDYENGKVFIKGKEQEKQEIYIPSKNGQIKFIALSDIHFGSKWDNVKLVNYAYELAEKENCQFITNSGDVFEGDFHNKRPDHIYQVKALGMEQLDYVIDKYPKSELPTYYIAGNHDLTFIKTAGADICKMLAKQRTDLTYLGIDIADIKTNGATIRLRHGNEGGSYAKSYKLQKYCETLPLNDIPDLILQGHFHYSGYFKNRDIHCINVPSLQGYTPYARQKGLPQEMGFWLITCNLDNKKGIVSLIPELYQFDEKRLIRKK